MKLGDLVKRVLAPFVKNTKFEHCDECEERRILLNKWSTSVVKVFNRYTCACYYRAKWHQFTK